jgi:hypothetical protein
VKKTSLVSIALLTAISASGAQVAATPPDNIPAASEEHADADAGTRSVKPGFLNGEIIETMNAAGYTYILLDTGSDRIWAASTETGVKAGQRVSVPAGQMMTDFTSNTLNRTFDRILFVSGIYPEGTPDGEAGQGHGMAGSGRTVAPDAHVEGVARAAGGYTIEEILARSSELDGQQVKVHGQVVKFSAGIMGTNWMHIQDSTRGDLAVTTDALVNNGDLVMVEGVLSVNKDFGAGYRYPAIIEKATVTKE